MSRYQTRYLSDFIRGGSHWIPKSISVRLYPLRSIQRREKGIPQIFSVLPLSGAASFEHHSYSCIRDIIRDNGRLVNLKKLTVQMKVISFSKLVQQEILEAIKTLQERWLIFVMDYLLTIFRKNFNSKFWTEIINRCKDVTVNDLRKYLTQNIEDKVGPKLQSYIQNELKILRMREIVSEEDGKLMIVTSGSERTSAPKRVQTSRKVTKRKQSKQKTKSLKSHSAESKDTAWKTSKK